MPVGETKKLSIAVLVDGRYKKNDNNEEVYEPLPKNEIEALEDLVKKSAGIDPQRGDQVVVTNMPFRKAVMEESEPASLKENIETFSPVFKYIGIFALIGFIALFVLRPLLKNVAESARTGPALQRAPAGAPPGDYAAQAAEETLRQAQAQRQMSDTEIARQLAKADAKQFADILRNWIK